MKKIFKKSLAVVVASALCLTALIGCFTASATSTTGTLKVDTVKIAATETTVVVPITMATTDERGIAASIFTLSFDNTALEFTDYEEPANIGVTTAMDEQGDTKITTDGTTSSVKFLIEAGSGMTFNSTTLNVSFAVKENLAANTYPVTISDQVACHAGDIEGEELRANNEDFVVLTVENGGVTVENAACEHENATKVLTNVTDTQFIYTCTCPDCGKVYTETVNISDDYDGSKGYTKSIEPSNDFSLLFKLKTERMTSFDSLAMVATKQVYEKGATEPTYVTSYFTNPEVVSSNGVENYVFTYSNIAAYEMQNVVSVKIYGLDSATKTMKLIKEDDYSVRAYVDLVYATSSDLLKKAFIDMLNYGTYSQQYANFNTANLANSGLSDDQIALGTKQSDYPTADSNYSTVSGVERPDLTTDAGRVSITKSVDPASKVNLLFKLTTYSGSLDNYYCNYEYYDIRGNQMQTEYYSFAQNGIMYEDTTPTFVFNIAPIASLDYPVKIHVFYGDPKNGGVEVINTPYSVESYISYFIQNPYTPQLTLMLQAMYSYGHSLANFIGVNPYVPN